MQAVTTVAVPNIGQPEFANYRAKLRGKSRSRQAAATQAVWGGPSGRSTTRCGSPLGGSAHYFLSHSGRGGYSLRSPCSNSATLRNGLPRSELS